MNRTRKCYDTTLIYLFILGKEHLLPVELLNSIPYSTRGTWRNYVKEKFTGHAQRSILEEGIRKTELYAKYKHIKQVLYAVETIYSSLADMIDLIKHPIYVVDSHCERVVDLIQQFKGVMGMEKLLEVFRISRSTYQSWLLSIKVKCEGSYFNNCLRRYGTQLTKQQVEIIKKALTCDTYKHWPIASIAYHFQRADILHISITSWYKYARLLGIVRKHHKKHFKTKGLVSFYPNEYWHVDITHFTTTDDVKHFVYFLSDNFSRKILAYKIGFSVNWQYVARCIKDAVAIATQCELPLDVKLIADGGPENINTNLDAFIQRLTGRVKKLIALKDIKFSNSPAEAKHRTFKMHYASEKDTANTAELIRKVTFFVNDFNSLRPAMALNGFTPDEVYFDQTPQFDFALLRKQDAILRKQTNENNACNKCELLAY